MGVPGLWKLLYPSAETRSLAQISLEEGFLKNENGLRAYRLGIDASIWFYHAKFSQQGKNPELRLFFYRCCKLLALPVMPIFVFDGENRPNLKRGRRIKVNTHSCMPSGLKQMFDAFGFEYRMAPGEAEAELARLNYLGIIDAIISDDVDCFLFGAHTVIRNVSAGLSTNCKYTKTTGIKGCEQQAEIYRVQSISDKIGLTQGGLILIALFSGGDYDEGLPGVGINIAYGLARAGFGDSLLDAAHTSTVAQLQMFLPKWRESVKDALRTNYHGFGVCKYPTLAEQLPDDFPKLAVLRYYTHPITSQPDTTQSNGIFDLLWKGRVDLGRIAHLCECYFEWGAESQGFARFGNLLWPGVVMRIMLDKTRRKAKSGIEGGGKTIASEDCRPDTLTLVTAIHGTRRHLSTGNLLEYHLEIDPNELIKQARAGIYDHGAMQGSSASVGIVMFPEECDGQEPRHGSKERPSFHLQSRQRLWIPADIVDGVLPGLVTKFKAAKHMKKSKPMNTILKYITVQPRSKLKKTSSKKVPGIHPRYDKKRSSLSVTLKDKLGQSVTHSCQEMCNMALATAHHRHLSAKSERSLAIGVRRQDSRDSDNDVIIISSDSDAPTRTKQASIPISATLLSGSGRNDPTSIALT